MMKTLRMAVAAVVVVACGWLAASPASAYPAVSLNITDNTDCCGNANLGLTVTSDPSGVLCITLTVSADNGVRVYKGGNLSSSQTWHNVTTPFNVEVRTPDVDHTTTAHTHATCVYDDTTVPDAHGSGGGGTHGFSTGLVMAQQSVSASGVLVISDCGNDHGNGNGHHKHHKHKKHHKKHHGHLPNTGGERLAWLIIGLLLVIGGASVVASSRREERGART